MSSSTASTMPSTPEAPYHDFDSSPATTFRLRTPPNSIRQYSTALVASMQWGMEKAMHGLNDQRREAERIDDIEYGYADEDPIERHVRLYLTPRREESPTDDNSTPVRPQVGEMVEMLHDGAEFMDADESGTIDFRPGLIPFHRPCSASSSQRSIPSFTNTDSTSSTSESAFFSGITTPYADGTDTPDSEASFEIGTAEDYMSAYGIPHRPIPLPSYGDRTSVISCSSILSTSSSGTIVPPPRPSLLRPRARMDPYPGNAGTRARQRENSGENAKLAPPTPIEEIGEEAWLQGRTISETMIAQAGLHSQRGRVNRR